MEETRVFVKEIKINTIGKIKEITLLFMNETFDGYVNCGQPVYIDSEATEKTMTYDEFVASDIKPIGIQILPTSIIVNSKYYNNKLINLDNKNNNKGFDCWIKEIYYENNEGYNEVIKIGLSAYTKSKQKELTALGGTVSEHDKNIVYFNINQLITMINCSDAVRSFLYVNGLTFMDKRKSLVFDSKIGKHIKLTRDTSYIEKINKWTTKAKALGIYNNFKINDTMSELVMINNISDGVVIIPPVRVLGYKSLMRINPVDVKELHIPDTVKHIDSKIDHWMNLKTIEFGENVLTIDSYAVASLSNVKYIDFKNIVRIPMIRTMENLNKIKVRIDCELPFNFVSDLSNLKTIEFKLGV